MEQWRRLQEYPNYSVSDAGQVRNDERERLMAITVNGRGHPYVGFYVRGRQIHRTLAILVANAFLPPAPPRFRTPIHLNSDLLNCRSSNLAWRPMWFAQKFTRQFNQDLGDAGPIKNVDKDEYYDSVWDIVYEKGVLFNDVIGSIYHKTYVFPIMERFEWA